MSLAARLSKLEERAPRALRCAWCLFSLRDTPAAEADKTPEEGGYILRRCPFCGTEYRASVRGHTPREVESFLLWDGKAGGETYRDERAYAAMEWWVLSAHARHVRRRRERDQRAASKPYAAPRAKPEVKETKEVREYRERKERAYALLHREAERQERLYGPRTFPLVARLKELEKEPKDFQLDEEKGFRSSEEKTTLWLRSFYERMAACEGVLWGEVSAETAAEIERLTAEAERLAVERKTEKLERERQIAREKEEREERYRVERETRERERLERMSPKPRRADENTSCQYVPGEDEADASNFWTRIGDIPGRIPGLVYIPPEEAKPQPPPDDGSDVYYHLRMIHWKGTGVWPTDEMLSRRQ